MTRARSHVIYTDLLQAMLLVYAPHVAREQAWRQQAQRVRLTARTGSRGRRVAVTGTMAA